MTILKDFLAIVIALFLVYVGPFYSMNQSIDEISDTIANSAVNNFQKEARKNGYIDNKTYINFVRELNRAGKVYDINMIHTSNLAFPSEKIEGDYEMHSISYGTDNILEVIKDGTSKYCMRYGDDYKVYIKEREVALSRAMLPILMGQDPNILLTFSGGGMVENEVEE